MGQNIISALNKEQDIQSMKGNILITGTSGFIGSSLTKSLINNLHGNNSCKIWCLSRKLQNFYDHPLVKILNFDCAQFDSNADQLPKFDYVFHIAADASFPGNQESYKNNITSTQSLISGLTKRSSETLKRVVFVSSIGAVDRKLSDPCNSPIALTDNYTPSSLYGKSKEECERLFINSNLPFSIIRPSWVYGANMRENSHLKALLLSLINKRLFSFFNFPGKVSLIHINDLCEALLFIATSNNAINKTFFIDDGDPLSIGAIVLKFRCLLNYPIVSLPVPKLKISKLPLISPHTNFKIKCIFQDALTCSSENLISIGYTPRRKFNDYAHQIVRSTLGYNSEKTFALVTGAASGLGKAIIGNLRAQNIECCAVDKNTDSLELLEKDNELTTIRADLSIDSDLEMVSDHIKSSSFDYLINCAGIGPQGEFCEMSTDQLINVTKVNAIAPIALMKAFMASSRRLKGCIVNISSSTAIQPIPKFGIYSASKRFLGTLSEIISFELREKIVVLTVYPSGMKTNFQTSNNIKQINKRYLMNPDVASSIIYKQIKMMKPNIIFVGRNAIIMNFISRLFPRISALKFSDYLAKKNL